MAALDTFTPDRKDAAAPVRNSFAARAAVTFCFLATSALLVSGLVGNTQSSKLSTTSSAVLAVNAGAQSK